MQGTSLYLLVFIAVIMLLPEDEDVSPIGLYMLGFGMLFFTVFSLSGGGTILLEALDK